MKHVPTLVLAFAILTFTFYPTSRALGQSSEYYELVDDLKRAQVYSSSVIVPEEEGSGRVGVSFRIPHAVLYFVQTTTDESDRAYRAKVEVEVDVYRDGQRIARRVWTDDPTVADYDLVESPDEDIEGAVWFTLEPGTYRYQVRITDLTSEHTARTRPRSIEISGEDSPSLSTPILARDVSRDRDRWTIDMFTLSGDIAYGEKAWAVVPVTLPDSVAPEDVQIHTALRKAKGEEGGRWIRQRRSQIVRSSSEHALEQLSDAHTLIRADTLSGKYLVPLETIEISDGSPGTFVLVESAEDMDTKRYLCVIDLRGEQLENKYYTLDVAMETSEARIDQLQTAFASHWRKKPYSLHDLNIAIEHLSFIVESDVINSLRSGSRRDSERRFKEFWAERDPTPETPFNELMAEYYRRVDYAADEFRTELKPVQAFKQEGGSVPDGLKSDRARMYIIHGPPASKERQNPRRGLVREKWQYDDGRTFVFEAMSKFDTFRLVEQYKYAGR